ncbi:hypothetical protein [Oryzifoliimicrobium ureilyticus]
MAIKDKFAAMGRPYNLNRHEDASHSQERKPSGLDSPQLMPAATSQEAA